MADIEILSTKKPEELKQIVSKLIKEAEEKARKDEKDKQYQTIEKLKTENNEYRSKVKEKEDLNFKEELQKIVEENEKRVKEVREESEKELKKLKLDLYKEKKIGEYIKQEKPVIESLIIGSSEEEINQALEKAAEEYKKIEEQIKKKFETENKKEEKKEEIPKQIPQPIQNIPQPKLDNVPITVSNPSTVNFDIASLDLTNPDVIKTLPKELFKGETGKKIRERILQMSKNR